ncbi:hypothetical protein FCH28_14785 [Streptomyces piniterrae]|uniref:Uncharacterized protein n=1 Tax=Streptomyces piniterrae TaxID=2571125 RepID=A0A4U0NJD0_9ACTN|nr:hypothetical protein FCH28_14785 [Streptomyces piniterrae]
MSTIVREDAPSRLEHPGHAASREELDWVWASAWGSTVKISDPALVDNGISSALEDEFEAQKTKYPDARIIAVCERDFGASYAKVLVAVPGAPDLTIDGWDELEVIGGDRRATLAAMGIDADRSGEGHDVADEADDEADGEEHDEEDFDYHGFLHVLTGGALSVYAGEKRSESAFAVERSKEGEGNIYEVWFPEVE